MSGLFLCVGLSLIVSGLFSDHSHLAIDAMGMGLGTLLLIIAAIVAACEDSK